jgi:hypothetical protein
MAHVHIVSHETRYGRSTIKSPPCGLSATLSARGEVVHTFQPGETITIEYDEYIPHPGHFRVSFDVDGEDDFVEPAAYDDLYTNETVLLDGIAAHANLVKAVSAASTSRCLTWSATTVPCSSRRS